MKKHFYTHLIDIKIVQTELDALELKPHEHRELLTLIHTTIHHVVVDGILSALDEDDKKKFLNNLAEDHHSHIWEHLHERIENIEEKIKKSALTILEELRRDIDEIKNSM